ncbi:MAG: hypothetical protein KOO63_07845 [Bacteroidales bacterium]|nr:hypothetical protein [Candidatus Latescibacterota bacterium]
MMEVLSRDDMLIILIREKLNGGRDLLDDEEVRQEIHVTAKVGGYVVMSKGEGVPDGTRLVFHIPVSAESRWYEEMHED